MYCMATVEQHRDFNFTFLSSAVKLATRQIFITYMVASSGAE